MILKKFLNNISIKYIVAFAASVIIGCNQYPDFSIQESNCYAIHITNNENQITLKKDTAWYVEQNQQKLFYADRNRINSLLNTLKDIDIQGISSYNNQSNFKYKIEIYKKNGNIIKTLKFNDIVSSPNMVGCCNQSDCYIVGIPGLNISPTINFNCDINYWKNLTLLEISPTNISKIAITDFTNITQSFAIIVNNDTFVANNYQGIPQPIPQNNIRQWLGTLQRFYAAQYCNIPNLHDSLKIYQVDLTSKNGLTENITFYKKILDNNQLDYNYMWFISNNQNGIVKYFDFDKLLVSIKYLE